MKTILVLSSLLLLAGCFEQQYRYPCQNPENWESPDCKKPICEVNRDCPEYVFKGGDLEKATKQPTTTVIETEKPSVPVKPSTKGECK